jgi:hypothetical protein
MSAFFNRNKNIYYGFNVFTLWKKFIATILILKI